MDNQQPSLEYRKVQRLSLRGVLSNVKCNIIWETPPIRNKVYLYKLVDMNDQPRYIGITNNPPARLYNHVRDKEINYKYNWLQKLIKSKSDIKMIVFESFDNIEDALIKEEYYINNLPNLTNLDKTPTKPNSKVCYLYDFLDDLVLNFDSLSSAMLFTKSRGLLHNKIVKARYLFSYDDDFTDTFKKCAKIKIKTPDDKIIYAFSNKHAAKILNCTLHTISDCMNKRTNNHRGHLISKIDKDFKDFKYKTSLKVICVNDDKMFNSIKEASDHYNLDASGIVKVCKNKRKSVGGLKFKYYE